MADDFDAFGSSGLGDFKESALGDRTRIQEFEDMPLTHACWDSTRSKIFGVRGGWVFEFEADGEPTGRKLCFTEPIGDAFIALDTTRDLLVVTNWWDPNINDQTDETLYRKGFFLIDPAELTVFDFIPMAYMSAGAPALATPQPVPTSETVDLSVDGYRSYVGVFPAFPPSPLIESGYVGTYTAHESRSPLVIGPFDQTVEVSIQLQYGWTIGDNPSYPSSLPADWQAIPFAQVSGGGPKYYINSPYTIFSLPAGSSFSVDIDMDLAPDTNAIDFPFSAGTFLIVAGSLPTQLKNARYQCGPRCVYVMDDGRWIFTEIDSFQDGVDRFALFDPGTLDLKYREDNDDESFNRDGHGWYDIWPEVGTITDNAEGIWGTNGRNFIRYADFVSGSVSRSNKEVYASPSAKSLHGLAFCDSNATLYAATASLDVATCLKDSPFTTATFELPFAPLRKPRRIRYVAFKDRLYIPTVMDNCVIEINPSDNSVTNTFEDFDVPYDIVATDAHVYAVQLGGVGLKLVV
jgi:hypothetical protein